MTVWEFDVGVTTHDLLKEGVTEAWRVWVRVWEEDPIEAHVIAGQIAGSVPGWYVTRIQYLE